MRLRTELWLRTQLRLRAELRLRTELLLRTVLRLLLQAWPVLALEGLLQAGPQTLQGRVLLRAELRLLRALVRLRRAQLWLCRAELWLRSELRLRA